MGCESGRVWFPLCIPETCQTGLEKDGLFKANISILCMYVYHIYNGEFMKMCIYKY